MPTLRFSMAVAPNTFVHSSPPSRVGDDPLNRFRRSAAEVITAFGEPGALERTVQHPMGGLPASQPLGMRVSEWAVHAWELARALDANNTLDAELIELIYARLALVFRPWRALGTSSRRQGFHHRASPGQAARPTRPTALTWPLL